MAAKVSPLGSGGGRTVCRWRRLQRGCGARAWYLVPVAVVLAAVAWVALGLVVLDADVSSFQRVALPGSGEITLTHSGRYVIYYEGPGASADYLPAITVSVSPLSASAAVRSITRYSGSLSISHGSHGDAAVLSLQIAHPGRFLVQADAPAAPAGSNVAVGSDLTGSIALIFFPAAAICVVGGVAFTSWMLYPRWRRRPAAVRFASQYGLSYCAAGGIDLAGYDFPLLREGDRRGYKNVLAGRWRDLPVTEADYWYSTRVTGPDRQSGRGYAYFSIVLADLAVAVPCVSIHRKNVFTKLAEHLGLHHIDFESEAFNREFRVTAADEQFAVELIDAAMIQWLLSTGGAFTFDIAGGNLLVSCDQLPVTELMPLFEAAKGFADHIPQLVSAGYGPPAHTAADAPPADEAPM